MQQLVCNMEKEKYFSFKTTCLLLAVAVAVITKGVLSAAINYTVNHFLKFTEMLTDVEEVDKCSSHSCQDEQNKVDNGDNVAS